MLPTLGEIPKWNAEVMLEILRLSWLSARLISLSKALPTTKISTIIEDVLQIQTRTA